MARVWRIKVLSFLSMRERHQAREARIPEQKPKSWSNSSEADMLRIMFHPRMSPEYLVIVMTRKIISLRVC